MKIFRRFLAVLAVLIVALGVAFWLRPVELARKLMFLRLTLSGADSRTISVAGRKLHYDVVGPEDGTPVVLVHGLGGRAEDWGGLSPFLVRGGFRVYMPDLLGFGRSDQPADFSYSIEDQAGVVVAFLDAMNLKQVDLGGWSMGGWIAQKVASGHPERVRRLMLFDSAGIYDLPKWNTSLFMPANADELDQLDALLMPTPPKVPGFVAKDILRISEKNRWVTKKALDAMLTGRDATDKLLPELKMPMLIVWGSEDHITPLSQAETIHRLVPQSQLEVIKGCGHLAPAQCAVLIGPKMVDFLKK